MVNGTWWLHGLVFYMCIVAHRMGSEVLVDNIGDWSKMGIAILLYYPQSKSSSFRIPTAVSIDWAELIISVQYKTSKVCFLFKQNK